MFFYPSHDLEYQCRNFSDLIHMSLEADLGLIKKVPLEECDCNDDPEKRVQFDQPS